MDEFRDERQQSELDKLGSNFRQQMELEAQRMELGATGRHPIEPVHATDEGEIRLAITGIKESETVVINFGQQISWIAFTPEQAIEIAQCLIKQAREVSKTPITVRLN